MTYEEFLDDIEDNENIDRDTHYFLREYLKDNIRIFRTEAMFMESHVHRFMLNFFGHSIRKNRNIRVFYVFRDNGHFSGFYNNFLRRLGMSLGKGVFSKSRASCEYHVDGYRDVFETDNKRTAVIDNATRHFDTDTVNLLVFDSSTLTYYEETMRGNMEFARKKVIIWGI